MISFLVENRFPLNVRADKQPPKALKYWHAVVDWMREIGDELDLHTLTIHIAIALLNRVLHAAEVYKKRLQLVSMCCVLLAAKYEELPHHVPTLAQLVECSNNPLFTKGLLRDMEVMILKLLKWYVLYLSCNPYIYSFSFINLYMLCP